MKDALLSLATSDQFAPFLLGVFVPYLYRWLTEAKVELSGRARFGFNVALCILAAFIPLGARWAMEGVPSGESVFTAITAALVASETMYRVYLKPKQEAAAA